MSFPGDMKLKPETAEEINDCITPQGMRRRLREYAHRGGEPIVRAILRRAEMEGLSGEDTMTWLAFEALRGMELYKGMVIENTMLNPAPPLFPTAASTRQQGKA